MKTYQEMSKEELQATYAELQKQFEEEKAKGEKYREMLAVVIDRLDSLK